MDKLLTTSKEALEVFEWKDNHKELIYKNPNPLPAIEIIITDLKIHLKCIRQFDNGKELLTIRINFDGDKLGYLCFEYVEDSKYLSLLKSTFKGIQDIDEPLKKQVNDVLTLYCSYMAYITYASFFDKKSYSDDECEIIEEIAKSNILKERPINKKNKKKKGYTYILKKQHQGNKILSRQNGHNSPSYSFIVRGHFRHYENGKIVWIASYKKGDKEKRSKNYVLKGKG